MIAQQAFLELFENAFRHGRHFTEIIAKAYSKAGNFVFELHEPKAKFEHSTKDWGREPLRYIGQGHYGLGLNKVRIVIEAHGGKFGADYDRSASALTTRITLPISK